MNVSHNAVYSRTMSTYPHIIKKTLIKHIYFLLQISEELEKVKQEMEQKGSSMSDGGKPHTQQQTLFQATDDAVCLREL